MKSNLNRLTPILLAAMFVYGGCAKQEVVKKDEPLASSRTTVAEAPTKTAVPGAGSAQEPSVPAPAPEAASAGRQGASQQANQEQSATPVAQELQKIFFDFDAATLSAAARETLTGNFQLLQRNPQVRLRIEGHCDERGSDDYNLALSERRAQAAQRYLEALGVSAERLSIIGYGKEKPADPGHDEAAWARNRRDEFVVLK